MNAVARAVGDAVVTVWRRPWVPAVALLVGAVAGAVSASAAPQYAAGTSLVVAVTGAPDGGLPDPATALSAAAGSLATPPVVDDIATRAEVPADAVPAAVTLAEAGTGGIAVTAVGDSPESAARLAAGARDALVAAENASAASAVAATIDTQNKKLIEVQLRIQEWSDPDAVPGGLQAEREALLQSITALQATPSRRLGPGPDPVAAPAPAGPDPVRDAVVAFLVALVGLGIGVPLHRAVRGRLPATSPGAQVQRDLDVPFVELDRSRRDVALDLTELYRTHLRTEPGVTVVQLTRPSACDVGAELVRSAALIGDRRAHDDRTPGSCRIVGVVDGTELPVVRTLRTRALDRALARQLVDSGVTVLVVETATARRPELRRVRNLLAGLGADVVAVVVWHGRIPRDPARPWSRPPDATLTGGVDLVQARSS